MMRKENWCVPFRPKELQAFRKAIAEALNDPSPLVSQAEMEEDFRKAKQKVAKAIRELEESSFR